MPKINIPIGLDGQLDYTAESKYLNALVYKIDRTQTGNCAFHSSSSNLDYSTDDYPNDPLIFNCGETGMIKLLSDLYGGQDGFLIMADDLNSYARKDPNSDNLIDGNGTVITPATYVENIRYKIDDTMLINRMVVPYSANLTLLSTLWSATAPYTQTISIPAIKKAFMCTCEFIFNESLGTAEEAQLADYNCISFVASEDGVLTFTCNVTKPTNNVSVNVTNYQIGIGGDI